MKSLSPQYQQQLDRYKTTRLQVKHYVSPKGVLIVFPNYSNNISQGDMRRFLNWALKNGWGIKPTYHPFESVKRAFTLTKGRYSITGIHRTTTRMSDKNPNGHHWDNDSVVVSCNIACFADGHNLEQLGITWQDIMSGDLDLLFQLRKTAHWR